MKKICVLTTTRAEYGLLKRLIIRLSEVPEFDVRVVVSGTHLLPEYGSTCSEIEADGINVDAKIPILTSNDGALEVSKSMARALVGFSEYFEKIVPNLLIVLGDRYETLAVCLAATNYMIPIAHLHGGEKTEGAADDMFRHAITKLSYLHFTAADQYRKRVIQLGEEPNRVFCVGALGTENILKEKLFTQEEVEESIHFYLGSQYSIVTFHPVTLEEHTERAQLSELLNALLTFSDMKYIITKANADNGGREINDLLEQFVSEHKEQFCLMASMGMKRYLSALKEAKMMIGNSSSGILEAPIFSVPTVNIGERQKGRIRMLSIIDCEPLKDQIEKAMIQAMDTEFLNRILNQPRIYGDGTTSEQITVIISDFLKHDKIGRKKKFYDEVPT